MQAEHVGLQDQNPLKKLMEKAGEPTGLLKEPACWSPARLGGRPSLWRREGLRAGAPRCALRGSGARASLLCDVAVRPRAWVVASRRPHLEG